MWPQFFRTEAPVEWMIYLLLGSLGTRICRIGGVLVNDLKLDFWLSLESMSSSHVRSFVLVVANCGFHCKGLQLSFNCCACCFFGSWQEVSF
ncbi:hypothetical protein CMV_008893 [Castanea mollissima]|uniref:Uncharacterized protein n=1 Tax=Castanea mollissima TaxID=60419 RepID=A0A8J4W1R6_9ROSI|nr:hypothetical protein CMV_008893 [Castanea mollissima]